MTAPPVPARLTAAVGTAGVILLVSWELVDPMWRWAVPAIVAVCLLLAWAVPVVASSLPPGGLPVALLAVAAASYACVPETDPMLRMAILPAVALVVEVVRRHPSPLAATWPMAALVLWAGVHGSWGRQSALVGAIFAWWPVGIAAVLGRAHLEPRHPWGWPLVLAPSFAATIAVARTGALERTVEPAIGAAAAWAGASAVVTLAVAFVLRRRPDPGGPVSGRGGRPDARHRPSPL